MEIREHNGRTILREDNTGPETYVMRVWVNDKLALQSEPLQVEFIDFRMNSADPEAGFTAHPVVRWRGELVMVPLVADDEAFWLGDPETLRDDMETLTRSWERYVNEPAEFRAWCTFVTFVLGDTEEKGE